MRSAQVALVAVLAVGAAHADRTLTLSDPTTVFAVAVAETAQGLVGSVSTIDVTHALGGSGEIFIATHPLAEVDMQGSARLAARVASAATGVTIRDKDLFIVVRSDSQVIGGPSAGSVMTAGIMASLLGLQANRSVFMTGTVAPNGDVGPIGGLTAKIQAATEKGGELFLYPEAQEEVTVTEVRGGVALTRRLVTSEYCDALGIACLPVGDVETAFRWLTGFELSKPGRVENVSSEAFARLLAPQASALIRDTLALASAASSALGDQRLSGSQRALLSASLDVAAERISAAENATLQGRHYTAASFSFQASIQARYVLLAAEYLTSGDRPTALERQFARVRGSVQDAIAAAKDVIPSTSSELGGVGAAQERATDAEQLVERALAEVRAGLTDRGLQTLAEATERTSTVYWWLGLSGHLRGGGVISLDGLRAAAEDLVSSTEETVTYAELILAAPLEEAQEELARASRDLDRGAFAGAIFEAQSAEVEASLALELAGLQAVPDGKLQRARERAAQAITEARGLGIEPVLAISLFEFAEDQGGDADGRSRALALFGSARGAADPAGVVLDKAQARDTRFAGNFTPPEGAGQEAGPVVGAFASGIAVALLFAIPVVLLSRLR